MARVVMLGDSAQTGFGSVTWDLGTRLLQHHDVRFISQNDTGEPLPDPMGTRTYAVEAIHPAQAIVNGFRDGWKPEATIILGDFFLTRAVVMASEGIAKAFESVPTFHYCPVEGTDLPPGWGKLWDIVRPVAMSEFGADQIALVTGKRPPVLTHGVDSTVFHPVSPSAPIIIPEADMNRYRDNWQGGDYKVMSKAGAKALFGLPPLRTLALRTDRNMPRKLYGALFRSMAKAMDRYDALDLLVHCRPMDHGGNLFDLCSKYPEPIAKRMFFTQAHDTYQGLPRSMLVALYNAADIYVSTSAEGFGLTIAEAMACGVAPVAMDFSAVSEVVGEAGKLIPVDTTYDNEYDHQWARPDENAFADAVVRLCERPAERKDLGIAAARRISGRFSWDETAAGFARLITEAVAEKLEDALIR
jgi:glycosyltransferase involved in cell wall biosynthesis